MNGYFSPALAQRVPSVTAAIRPIMTPYVILSIKIPKTNPNNTPVKTPAHKRKRAFFGR